MTVNALVEGTLLRKSLYAATEVGVKDLIQIFKNNLKNFRNIFVSLILRPTILIIQGENGSSLTRNGNTGKEIVLLHASLYMLEYKRWVISCIYVCS